MGRDVRNLHVCSLAGTTGVRTFAKPFADSETGFQASEGRHPSLRIPARVEGGRPWGAIVAGCFPRALAEMVVAVTTATGSALVWDPAGGAIATGPASPPGAVVEGAPVEGRGREDGAPAAVGCGSARLAMTAACTRADSSSTA